MGKKKNNMTFEKIINVRTCLSKFTRPVYVRLSNETLPQYSYNQKVNGVEERALIKRNNMSNDTLAPVNNHI